MFAAADDYSFGVLQSAVHWAWFRARCSTLKRDVRYTSNAVFDAFAWPQSPAPPHVRAVADAAVRLRTLQAALLPAHGHGLRELHRSADREPNHPLQSAQEALDVAVRAAYGMDPADEPLAFLLALNHAVADREARDLPVTGPGLPPCIPDAGPLITADCIVVQSTARRS